MKRIECVILDWAGTSVDYGCFAPVSAFIESFKSMGLEVTAAETRAHMGLTKIEEIRALFRIGRVAETFREKYGRARDSVDTAKQHRIRLAASNYIALHKCFCIPRCDIAEVYVSRSSAGLRATEFIYSEAAF